MDNSKADKGDGAIFPFKPSLVGHGHAPDELVEENPYQLLLYSTVAAIPE